MFKFEFRGSLVVFVLVEQWHYLSVSSFVFGISKQILHLAPAATAPAASPLASAGTWQMQTSTAIGQPAPGGGMASELKKRRLSPG